MGSLGTRTKQSTSQLHPPGGALRSSYTRDVGMSKRVSVTTTFTAVDGRITGVAGDFTAFANKDPIVVQGAVLNAGAFLIVGLDEVDHAYLTVDPAPKDEGPIAVTIRTP